MTSVKIRAKLMYPNPEELHCEAYVTQAPGCLPKIFTSYHWQIHHYNDLYFSILFTFEYNVLLYNLNRYNRRDNCHSFTIFTGYLRSLSVRRKLASTPKCRFRDNFNLKIINKVFGQTEIKTSTGCIHWIIYGFCQIYKL